MDAGVLLLEVVEAAAQHGLAALAGTSPNVGVVGYTLGGGLSFLGRKYGLAANSVNAIELVTVDGRFVRSGPFCRRFDTPTGRAHRLTIAPSPRWLRECQYRFRIPLRGPIAPM